MTRTAIPQKQNLLKYSEDFTQSGTWAQTAIASVAANQIANPRNGLVNVSGLIATSTSTFHNVHQTITLTAGSTYTLSVYAKAGNQSWLYIGNTTDFVAYFNLAGSGATGTVLGGTATIQALPNGWFLCSLTGVPSLASNTMLLETATANGSITFAGDNVTINTYLFGAMVAQSNGLTLYTSTTSAAVAGAAERVFIPQTRNINIQNQNLFAYSRDFNNVSGWTANNINFTANTTDTLDPFGGNAAFKWTDTVDGGNTAHLVQGIGFNAAQLSTYTVSAYAKAGTLGFFTIAPIGGTYICGFNLTDGVSTSTTNATNAVPTIQSVGNGWYRCSVTFASGVGGSQNHRMYMANALTGLGEISYQGNGTGTVYVFGAQLTLASTPGVYTLTTGTLINNGALRNAIPQTQNIVTWSQDFSHWTTANSSIVANAATDPFGGNNGTALVENTTNGTHSLSLPYNAVTVGQLATLSIYVKAGTRSWCALQNGPAASYFNLSGAGSIGSQTGSGFINPSIQALPNGWYRISLSIVQAAGSLSNLIYSSTGDLGVTYPGTNGAQAIYVFGGQAVQANWAGPYTLTTTASLNNGPIRNVP